MPNVKLCVKLCIRNEDVTCEITDDTSINIAWSVCIEPYICLDTALYDGNPVRNACLVEEVDVWF